MTKIVVQPLPKNLDQLKRPTEDLTPAHAADVNLGSLIPVPGGI